MSIDCNQWRKPMKLDEKIKQMEKEVGHVPMVCLQTDCEQRSFHFVKNYHCREEIPYVKRIGDKIHVLSLCTLKIEEYWKR